MGHLSQIPWTLRCWPAAATQWSDAAPGSGSVFDEVAFAYDAWGNLLEDTPSHAGAVGGTTPSVGYAYRDGSDNSVRRTTVKYPRPVFATSGFRTVAIGYGPNSGADDRLGRVAGLTSSGETDAFAAYTYVGLARHVRVAYEAAGVELTYIGTGGNAGDPYPGYDIFGNTREMKWRRILSPATILDHTKYGYDLDSRRTWREVPLAGATQQGQAFSYDDLSQLKVRGLGELDAGSITAPDRKETFTYDPTGNCRKGDLRTASGSWEAPAARWQWSNYLRQKKVGGSLIDEIDQDRTHNAGNQITQFDGSSTMVEYDGNGNATKTPPLLAAWGEAMDLTWDAWNRLVKVENDSATVAEYAYDALWRRTMKTAGGQTTHFFYNDQWRPLEERPGSATAPAEFTYLWGSRHRDDLVRRDGSPGGSSGSGSGSGSSGGTGRLYVAHDYFDPTCVFTEEGTVVERYGYSGFGVRRVMAPDFTDRAASAYAFAFAFHGQFEDAETGMANYGYRYCAPSEAWHYWQGESPCRENPKGGSPEEQALTKHPYRVLRV